MNNHKVASNRRIIHFIRGIYYGDAQWYYLLNLKKLFDRLGIDNLIFVEDENCKNQFVKNVSEYRPSKKDIAILHYSNYFEINSFAASLDCLKIMNFQNVTPPDFFRSYSDELCEKTGAAYKELPAIASKFNYIITHSEFSKQTLLKNAMAIENRIKVISLLLDFSRYRKSAVNKFKKILQPYTKILFVSRIFPNKRQDLLVDMMNILVNKYNKRNFRLYLVGTALSEYYKLLKTKIKTFSLEKYIHITGEIKSDEELLMHYKTADVFVCPSEHEGFCAPIVEAAFYNLPIIAFDQPAVKETILDKHVLINENKAENYADAIMNYKNIYSKSDITGFNTEIISFHKKTEEKFSEYFLSLLNN